MPLTDTAIRRAKPAAKPKKLYDERGLFLLIHPNGGKWWRFKYRFDGKEKLLSLGTYPEVRLKEARERREDARRQVSAGIDPSGRRKALKAAKLTSMANNFETIAREWFGKHAPNWSQSHSDRVLSSLERDLFPWLGHRPIAEIKPPELLQTVRRIEDRGALETAHRTLANCGQVLRYAIATGRAERDISADLKGALPPFRNKKHLAAVTEPSKVGALLQLLDAYEGTLVVRSALRIAPLVFVRPGELRHAQWKDIDLENAAWSYLVTKTNTPHVVPLARQAMEVLKELKPLTGSGKYVFPSARSPRGDRPMSDNAILAAMRTMGVSKEEMSGHGFRAMARTILDEVLGFRPDYIEHQLAHAVRDPNGRAYNRTAHLPERRKMMQEWADYLDDLKAGEKILPE